MINKQIEKMIEFINSEAGNVFTEKYFNTLKSHTDRLKRVEEYIETHNFDELMYRLILKHNDDYFEKCRHNGCEPYPNNVLGLIIDYIVENVETINVNELKCKFPNRIREFNGYYFQIIFGQGTLINIFNKEDKRLLLQI